MKQKKELALRRRFGILVTGRVKQSKNVFRRRWVGQLVCHMAQRMSAGDALEDAVTPGDPGTRVCRFGGLMWDAEKEQWDLSSQARESCVTSKNTKTVRDHNFRTTAWPEAEPWARNRSRYFCDSCRHRVALEMKARGTPVPMEAPGGEGAGEGAEAGRAALSESVQTPEPTLPPFLRRQRGCPGLDMQDRPGGCHGCVQVLGPGERTKHRDRGLQP